MNAFAHHTGGGFMPSQNFISPPQPIGFGYNATPIPGHFPGALEAVAALPPRLNKVVWNLHNRYGVSLDIALGVLLGVLSFVGQGACNGRDAKGDPLPLGAIVHVIGVPVSAKSVVFRRLLQPAKEAMRDWSHQWEFDDSTPQGIKRVSPVLGFCGHEEGDAFFDTAMGRDFALQISLRDGFVPVVTRAKGKESDRKTKGVTRFATVVLIQPDRYQDWLDARRKKALGSGFLQRVWMVQSYAKVDKSAIGRYPQAEGGLDDWDTRVPELLEQGKANGNLGFANLFAMDVAMEASHALNQEQSRYDFMAEQGALAQAPAVAARYHEIVGMLSALFQLYEGVGRIVTPGMMQSAIVVANYLVGQWLSVVFPPKPQTVPQQELDARTLLPSVLKDFHERGVTAIPETEIVTQAKNLGWGPGRAKAALMALYAAGYLHVFPRTINRRRLDMVELPTLFSMRWPLLR